MDCIGEVLKFVLVFDPKVKDSAFVTERLRVGDHRHYLRNELAKEGSVLLGEEEIGPQSRGTAHHFLDFVVDVDVVRSHEGTRFGVDEAEDFHVRSRLPPSNVNVVVEVVDPRHRLSDGHVIVDHYSSVVGEDAHQSEVAGYAAALPHHFGHFFVALPGFGGHQRLSVGLGDDGNVVASLLGEVLVVLVVELVEYV